jgi:hypothetical protein
MRFNWKQICLAVAAMAILVLPRAANATSCTSQAQLQPQDRDALMGAAGRLGEAVAGQDYSALQGALLPAVATDWEGIRAAVEQTASLLKGGQLQLRNIYLLDANSLTAPTDTQFFCSNANGSMTVTISMRALPPGRYAVVLGDSAGSPYGGHLSIILAWAGVGATGAWKLGGVSVRPGFFDGHDGVWYWSQARELARGDAKSEARFDSWSAWFSYEVAKMLLIPVDFLSSPNLEKLGQEQSAIRNSPQDAFPLTVADGDRTWKIDSVKLDPTLLHADLGVVFESTGVTDPAAQKTEAIAVLSALLKVQPGLRGNFHGLWAYANKDGKQTPVIELPMAQIP